MSASTIGLAGSVPPAGRAVVRGLTGGEGST
jgi:hypothetical protein